MITMLPLRTNRLGQLTDAVSNMNAVTQQAQASMPAPSNPNQNLVNMINQQATTLEQSGDALSRAWWATNWPIVAVGLGALGIMGYHLIIKKQ